MRYKKDIRKNTYACVRVYSRVWIGEKLKKHFEKIKNEKIVL